MSSESTPDGAGAHDPDPARETTLHVVRALSGEEASLDWIVEKFSPLLLASASYRLSGRLRRVCDPEDLVNDVWLVALGRLADLEPRDGRYTPVLLRFLSSTLLNKLNNLFRKHVLDKPRNLESSGLDDDPVARVESPWTGVITRVARREAGAAVSQCLEQLSDRDRELIILRGVEQHPYREIAVITGRDPKALAVEYWRGIGKLRKALPRSVFAELIDE
jgi:RNA polymerase sigma factor (sigma-70 family)